MDEDTYQYGGNRFFPTLKQWVTSWTRPLRISMIYLNLISTLTRHQRGLISSLYHYCVGNDKGKESKVWGYNSFVWADNGRNRWKKVWIFGDYRGRFHKRKEDQKKFKRVKKKDETKMLKSTLNWKNKVIAINTCALSVLIKYGAGKIGKRRTESIG